MSTIVFTAVDAEFDDNELAQGTEVRSRSNELKAFLEGNNLDPTDNLDLSVPYAHTARTSYTVNDASNHNLNVVVQAVMNAATYGARVFSSAAQVNAELAHLELSSGSSTVSVLTLVNAGTGVAQTITQTGAAGALTATCSDATTSANVYTASQAGTANLFGGTLRSLASLVAPLTATSITTAVTIDNTDTETAVLAISLPANFLKAGTTIRGRVFGAIDTPASSLADARFYLKYGGVAGTELLDSGAVTLADNLADSLATLEFTVTCLTTGATGTIEAQGILHWGSNTAPTARGLGTAGTGATNPAAVTIDTTAANDLTLSFDWSAAGAGHTAVIRSGYMEILQ